MFERFTDRARRSVELARQAACDMGHREVDTGHLLVGVAGEGGGVAFRALTALGVTPEMVREAVWNRHPGESAQGLAHRDFTPGVNLPGPEGPGLRLGHRWR
jgi:ATP-dependent Clp protease ATP-binding subunit ClpC